MKVLFRTDASVKVGSGHLMRCLTLARDLRARGCHILFVCRELPNSLRRLLDEEGYQLWLLSATSERVSQNWEEDAAETIACIKAGGATVDWVVVDHYDLDASWERSLRQHTKRLMVIDDLADRSHECELLLDQNLHDGSPYQERGRVSDATEVLMGPHYALLRKEFLQARERIAPRTGTVQRMVICFGSTDPTGETAKALTALRQLDLKGMDVDVITGAGNPNLNDVAEFCASLPRVHFHPEVSNMAHFLARADMAVGAAGVSTWERLVLGVPSLVAAIAENQRENMKQLHQLGLAIQLGVAARVSISDMAAAMRRMISAPDELSAMSRRAFNFVDGKGTTRVADRLMMVTSA